MRALAALLVLALTHAAAAQIGVPAVRLPSVGVPNLPAATAPLDATLPRADDVQALRELRRLHVRELLRHREVIETDRARRPHRARRDPGAHRPGCPDATGRCGSYGAAGADARRSRPASGRVARQQRHGRHPAARAERRSRGRLRLQSRVHRQRPAGGTGRPRRGGARCGRCGVRYARPHRRRRVRAPRGVCWRHAAPARLRGPAGAGCTRYRGRLTAGGARDRFARRGPRCHLVCGGRVLRAAHRRRGRRGGGSLRLVGPRARAGDQCEPRRTAEQAARRGAHRSARARPHRGGGRRQRRPGGGGAVSGSLPGSRRRHRGRRTGTHPARGRARGTGEVRSSGSRHGSRQHRTRVTCGCVVLLLRRRWWQACWPCACPRPRRAQPTLPWRRSRRARSGSASRFPIRSVATDSSARSCAVSRRSPGSGIKSSPRRGRNPRRRS